MTDIGWLRQRFDSPVLVSCSERRSVALCGADNAAVRYVWNMGDYVVEKGDIVFLPNPGAGVDDEQALREFAQQVAETRRDAIITHLQRQLDMNYVQERERHQQLEQMRERRAVEMQVIPASLDRRSCR